MEAEANTSYLTSQQGVIGMPQRWRIGRQAIGDVTARQPEPFAPRMQAGVEADMAFRISGLPVAPFAHLFGLGDKGLADFEASQTHGRAGSWAAEKIGADIIRRALEEPLRQIAENAGYEGSVEVNRVKAAQPGFGFDAMSGDLVDMLKAGIVKPFKVTRSALQNAASIGALILTTETLIADKPEPKKDAPGGGGGMGGMGGMGGGYDMM